MTLAKDLQDRQGTAEPDDGKVAVRLSVDAVRLLANLLAGPTPIQVPLSDVATVGALMGEIQVAMAERL